VRRQLRRQVITRYVGESKDFIFLRRHRKSFRRKLGVRFVVRRNGFFVSVCDRENSEDIEERTNEA
jgi:hypothetical protein